MDHRYGRHGPYAWLRWRKRHYVHSTMLPAHVPRASVVYVRLPVIDAERIIIIMLNPNNDGEKKELEIRNGFDSAVDGTISRSYTQEDHDFIEEMEIVAHDEGLKRAQEDIEKLGVDISVELLPLKEQLHREAMSYGIKYVQVNNPSARGDAEKQRSLSKLYADAYVDGYQQWVQKDLPDEETSRIWQIAYKDKSHFQDRLYAHYVAYLAVIRAQEHLSSTLGPEITPEGLHKIGEYVEIYRQAYNEKERL